MASFPYADISIVQVMVSFKYILFEQRIVICSWRVQPLLLRT
jgi:hypothetical protein